jgi:hypothetical protein
MPPNFDQQARDILDECPLMLCDDDLQFIAPDIARALSAAYRAGMERAAQLADGCGYGKEAAARIREEIAQCHK